MFKRLSKNADFEKYFAHFVYQFPSKVYLTVVLSVYRLRTRTYTDQRKHMGDGVTWVKYAEANQKTGNRGK